MHDDTLHIGSLLHESKKLNKNKIKVRKNKWENKFKKKKSYRPKIRVKANSDSKTFKKIKLLAQKNCLKKNK